MSLYHQRQQGAMCRLHTINNLIGREVCNTSDFNKYCDEFDKKNKFEVSCSKLSQEFYNNGNNDNIFGYTLAKKGINVKIMGYDRHRKQPINVAELEKDDDLLGACVLQPGHTWCVRYHNKKWIVVDSMNAGQPQVQHNYFQNKNLGFLFVYRDSDLDLMNKLDLYSIINQRF
jgi:hypothetical protein|uniref:ubiquitinyl hydrolase 1 n=1 Tax=viral metagenome TaxID=1070528 RepID=A0A6C0LHW9_9ZZZZ